MKKISIKMTLVLLAAFLVSVFGTSSRVAASGRAIAISPTSQKIVLVPGETYRGGFEVVNPYGADGDLHYTARTSSFSQIASTDSKDDYGDVDFETKTNMNTIVDWTTLENATGTVEPNGQKTITFKIAVPEDAPAGGQYMAILVREDPKYTKSNTDSLSVNEVMQMAFVVYAEVSGETRRDAEILENNIPSFLFSNQLQATSRVKNDGNIHADATYTFQVWPMFSDEEICTNEEKPNTSFIMPGTERYHTESCQLPLVGIFRAKQTVKIFGEESIVERTVLVCPVWLLFLVIFVIVAMIIWLVMKAKARKEN